MIAQLPPCEHKPEDTYIQCGELKCKCGESLTAKIHAQFTCITTIKGNKQWLIHNIDGQIDDYAQIIYQAMIHMLATPHKGKEEARKYFYSLVDQAVDDNADNKVRKQRIAQK
jgi:hypothetical protein